MEKTHWLTYFAENYSGSGDIDAHSVADGSETSNSELQDPLLNGGVQMDNEYQPAMMPYSLDVHDEQNSQADKDKPNARRSDEYSDFPFGEAVVDNNHANVVAGLNNSDDDIAGGGANFLHHAPDSPSILNDGHPANEMVATEVPSSMNNFVSKPTPQLDSMLTHDPSLTLKNPDEYQGNIPDINKGRTAKFQRSLNPFGRSAREIRQEAEAWTDTSGSNVDQITNPSELGIKHRKSRTDFGTGDQTGDGQTMSSSPMQGLSGDDYESSNYSGIQPTSSADETLRNYLSKIGLKKKADPGPVPPSVNVNSGRDELDTVIHPQPRSMSDGKMTPELADKVDYDPFMGRNKLKYNRTEDDDKQRYYEYLGTGGGFGGEGNGDFSGIQSGD